MISCVKCVCLTFLIERLFKKEPNKFCFIFFFILEHLLCIMETWIDL
jgi:hypothetical protein